MKNIRIILIISALITAFYSCTKTITPPLNNVSQLVIEGAVSDTTGPFTYTSQKQQIFIQIMFIQLFPELTLLLPI